CRDAIRNRERGVEYCAEDPDPVSRRGRASARLESLVSAAFEDGPGQTLRATQRGGGRCASRRPRGGGGFRTSRRRLSFPRSRDGSFRDAEVLSPAAVDQYGAGLLSKEGYGRA